MTLTADRSTCDSLTAYAIDVPSLGDKDSGIVPTHVPDFSFKIYKPNIFRRLRAQFGISEADFRNSLEATQQIGSAKTALMNCFLYSVLHCFGLFLGVFWGN